MLPSSVEGHVQSIGLGHGQGRDDESRTGERGPSKDGGGQSSKLSDQQDHFISSEVAMEADPKTTS